MSTRMDMLYENGQTDAGAVLQAVLRTIARFYLTHKRDDYGVSVPEIVDRLVSALGTDLRLSNITHALEDKRITRIPTLDVGTFEITEQHSLFSIGRKSQNDLMEVQTDLIVAVRVWNDPTLGMCAAGMDIHPSKEFWPTLLELTEDEI